MASLSPFSHIFVQRDSHCAGHYKDGESGNSDSDGHGNGKGGDVQSDVLGNGFDEDYDDEDSDGEGNCEESEGKILYPLIVMEANGSL